MKKIAKFLTLIVLGMLLVTACVQQPLDQTGSGTPTVEPAATAVPSGTPSPTAVVTVEVGTAVAAVTSPPLSEITPVSLTSTPFATSADGQIIVTLADRGKTLNLAVGENFLLKLGEEYTWEVTISDQTVVSRAKNILTVLGSQGIFEALQPGTVTLTAAGDPVCRQNQPPCGRPSIQFTMTIVVK